MIDRFNVQVFIFSLSPGFELLLLKRVPERSGHWQPISGGIETGESYIDAIKREVGEETGIRKLLRIIDLNYVFIFHTMWKGKFSKMKVFCYAAEIQEPRSIVLSQEHENYLWCTEIKAKELLKWEHNLIALDKLIALLNNEKRL